MISSISFCGGKLPVTSQKLAEQKAARLVDSINNTAEIFQASKKGPDILRETLIRKEISNILDVVKSSASKI